MTHILVNILLPLILSPLLLGVINRTKAIMAGRRGQPLFQPYYDIWKLLHKAAVYSRTTSWIFRAGPMVSLAAILTASATVPLGERSAPLHFAGDLILLAYLLGLARFFTVIAALDTGSAFEGMGASREVTFSTLAEPAFLLGLAALARLTDNLSVSEILYGLTWQTWATAAPLLAMVAAAMLIVFLAENARIPVDDPNTHLELTMIHEVMVLDHSGPDFAFILYGSAMKMWVLGAILIQTVLPASYTDYASRLTVCLAGMFVLAVVVGVIESVMARLRMIRVPQLLVAAIAFSLLAVILALRQS